MSDEARERERCKAYFQSKDGCTPADKGNLVIGWLAAKREAAKFRSIDKEVYHKAYLMSIKIRELKAQLAAEVTRRTAAEKVAAYEGSHAEGCPAEVFDNDGEGMRIIWEDCTCGLGDAIDVWQALLPADEREPK